ncbi:TPA: hypothetical protein ACH3X1_013047 [Trebouxia sp. C0004]
MGMFGFERFWKHLKGWVTQRTHVEALMWNAHAAYNTSCLALSELAEELLADEEDSIYEGHRFPELTKGCACCGEYESLWNRFVQAEVSGNVTKSRLPELLDSWLDWARQQPDLCDAQHSCTGPRRPAEVFDRATIQGVISTRGQEEVTQ